LQINFLFTFVFVFISASIFIFVIIIVIIVIPDSHFTVELRHDGRATVGTSKSAATVKTLQAQTVNTRLIDCTHFTVGDAVNCTGHTDDS